MKWSSIDHSGLPLILYGTRMGGIWGVKLSDPPKCSIPDPDVCRTGLAGQGGQADLALNRCGAEEGVAQGPARGLLGYKSCHLGASALVASTNAPLFSHWGGNVSFMCGERKKEGLNSLLLRGSTRDVFG